MGNCMIYSFKHFLQNSQRRVGYIFSNYKFELLYQHNHDFFSYFMERHCTRNRGIGSGLVSMKFTCIMSVLFCKINSLISPSNLLLNQIE